jgi:hypothetical protein
MVARLLVDLCQDTAVSLACALKKETGGFFFGDLLMVSEKVVLLISDLDW